MVDPHQVRQRLLDLDQADVRLIAGVPGLGDLWAKRANVKRVDLAKGGQRAHTSIRTAMLREPNDLAADLAKLWNLNVVPFLNPSVERPDQTLLGVRLAAALIGARGARALVASLAADDYEISAEMAERFDELSDAADHPLPGAEAESLVSHLEQLVPAERLAEFRAQCASPKSTVPEVGASNPVTESGADSTDNKTELDAEGAWDLLSRLRSQAEELSAALSAVASEVLAGETVSNLQKDIDTWNATLAEAWCTLGGLEASAAISFEAMESLRARIVERESAAAESAREDKVAKLEQLRKTIAGLEPMIDDDETFRTAYEVACGQVNLLEDELGEEDEEKEVETSPDDTHRGWDVHSAQASEESPVSFSEKTTAEIGREECTSPVPADDAPTDNSKPTDATAGTAGESIGGSGDAPAVESPDRAPDFESSSSDGLPGADPTTGDLPQTNSADNPLRVDRKGNSEASESIKSEHTRVSDTSAGDSVSSADDHGTEYDFDNELTFHVKKGEFGAAWLVAVAADLPKHEVKAYRHAAAAFHSAPGGIDPAEVLVNLTTNVSESEDFSCQSARVALAATLRTTLAAGWSPRSELEAIAAQANLDVPGRDLVSAVIAAADRNYQHLHDFGNNPSFSLEAVRDKALSVHADMGSLPMPSPRASRVLKYLLRADEPLGAAFHAVLADTSGVERRDALTAALAALESPDDVIEAADALVSTHLQRLGPIKKHPLKRLHRAVDATAECVSEALNAAVFLADNSRTVVAHEVRNSVVAAAEAVPLAAEVMAPGDAALARLVGWIIKPDPPNRVSNESELLLDETLPAISADRDHDGLPIIDANCAAAVIAELRSPGSWRSLFDAYAARGDLKEAEAVVRHEPELQERMSTVRTDWRRRLEREVSATRADLARTYADGAMHSPMADNAQVEAEARLVAPGNYAGDRYDLQMADLRRLRAEFADHRSRAAEHLRVRVSGEVRNDSDKARILALIDEEDFVGANELLALARSGTLPPIGGELGDVGSRMFTAFVQALSSLDGSTTPSVEQLISMFGDSQLNEVGKTDQARLASWGDLAPRRGQNPRSRQGTLFAVLRAMGLDTRGEPTRQTSPGVRHFDLFRVHATPVDGSLVPGLGSQATHYMVAVTADHKLLRETLSSGFPAKNGPNIVLFDGLLTMEQRQKCLTACRDNRISAIVVDRAVAAFVAARNPRSFRAVQQLTLPFTCFTHYTVVAGNVPDEVFVGRNDELTQLADRSGSLFVYGGRQLGKSALLRKIQRDFNLVPDHHAIFIDLNSHGIGTWADPQQLWPVLHNELAKIGSMGIKANSAVRNHDVVIKAIRHWLDGKESRRLLLLLDEADAFLEKESGEAPVGFRNIGPLKGLFDDTEGRFKPVFAGLHKVQRLQNIANTPLAHGGRDVLIGPLAAKPARDLVIKPLEALGYRFENPEAVWRLLAFTNLQPGLIQVVCNDLVAHLQFRPLRNGEPLVAISDTDVDYITGNETTRNKIAEKLRLTIALEDRYRVIALAVAIMSMEDSFRERYPAADIREHCEVYWPQGFEDLNSAQFEVYLDELVGLGVLTRDRENLFAVRSPNIVTMLGSKEQLETELEENREQFELPHEYNPRSTRRQVTSGDRVVRSPLSEHGLSQLVPVQKKYKPRDFVIVGGEALGITEVAPVLVQVGSERGAQVTVFDAGREDVVSALGEFRWAGGGTSSPRVVVVDGSLAGAQQAAEIADTADSVRKRGHGHLVMVLGPGAIEVVAARLAHWSITDTRLMPLEKWSGDGIRSWRDNPFNTPTERQDLLRHSGGWPELVERAVIDVSNKNVTYAEEWDRLSKFPESGATATQFLQHVGIGESDFSLLSAWAQLGSTTHEGVEDISAVLDRDIGEVRSVARRLTLLGAVDEHQGEFLIDPVVVRALTALA